MGTAFRKRIVSVSDVPRRVERPTQVQPIEILLAGCKDRELLTAVTLQVSEKDLFAKLPMDVPKFIEITVGMNKFRVRGTVEQFRRLLSPTPSGVRVKIHHPVDGRSAIV